MLKEIDFICYIEYPIKIILNYRNQVEEPPNLWKNLGIWKMTSHTQHYV